MSTVSPAMRRLYEATRAALEHDELEGEILQGMFRAFRDHRLENHALKAMNDMKEKANV